jgi:HlyD family secretion protein
MLGKIVTTGTLFLTRPGIVKKIAINRGTKVKAGDLLLQLDDREARAKLESATALLEAVEAELKAQEIDRRNAREITTALQRLINPEVAAQARNLAVRLGNPSGTEYAADLVEEFRLKG